MRKSFFVFFILCHLRFVLLLYLSFGSKIIPSKDYFTGAVINGDL